MRSSSEIGRIAEGARVRGPNGRLPRRPAPFHNEEPPRELREEVAHDAVRLLGASALGAGVSNSDFFQNADEMYTSVESAEFALRSEIPGNKPARPDAVATRMVKAARRGLEDHYRQLISSEWYKYQDKLEKALARTGEPQFSDPIFSPEDQPSDTWRTAQGTIAFAKAYFGEVTATIQARRDLMTRMGKEIIEHVFLDNPRDGAKVMMVLEMLRDRFDGQYDDPLPVELALIAVILGVDKPMRRGVLDGGENRRARWLATLMKAKELLKLELSPEPPPSGGR